MAQRMGHFGQTMAKTKTISVTVSKTLQVTQFEPIRIEVTQAVTLDPEETPREVRAQLYDECSRAVRTMMKKEIEVWEKVHA